MLTIKQKETYEAIKTYIREHRIAPTEAELAELIGIQSKSRGVVHRYLTALSEAGLIKLIPNRRRNIELLATFEDHELPVLGWIAAGRPIEAIEDQTSFNVSDTLLGTNRFILRVKGDSMIGDSICDGDYIICERKQTAAAHEIAICLVANEEATLKRIKNNHDGTVTLLPSNPSLKPMHYPAESVSIQGVYVGLIRLTA